MALTTTIRPEIETRKNQLISLFIFSKKTYLLRHFIFWLIMYFSETLLKYQPNNDITYIIKYLSSVITLVGLTYFILYYLLPRKNLKNKLVLFIFICLLLESIYTFYLVYLFKVSFYDFGYFFLTNFTRNTIILGSAIGIKLFKTSCINHERIKNIQIAKFDLELKQLKNHISPHFLLNSLNNVLVMHRMHHPETEESIVGLSEILKYQLYYCTYEKVPLKKEIEYIQNFNKIEKIRKKDLDIHFSIVGMDQIQSKHIEPFLFTSFIENAYKYLRRNNSSYYIKMELTVNKDYLTFFIKNSTSENFKQSIIDEIADENINKRFNLLFGEKYSIKKINGTDFYATEIEIDFSN